MAGYDTLANGLLSFGLTQVSNQNARDMQNKSYEQNKSLQEAAQRFNAAEAQKQRYAASATSLYNQYKALGLNTDLLYSGGSSQGGMVSASSTPASAPLGQSFPYTAVGDMTSSRLASAQEKLVDAQARKISAEADDQEWKNDPSYRALVTDIMNSSHKVNVERAEQIKNDSQRLSALADAEVVRSEEEKTSYDIRMIALGEPYPLSRGFDSPEAKAAYVEKIKNSVEYKDFVKKLAASLEHNSLIVDHGDPSQMAIVYDIISRFGSYDPDDPRVLANSITDLQRQLLQADVIKHNTIAEHSEAQWWIDAISEIIGAITGGMSNVGIKRSARKTTDVNHHY